MISGRVFLSCCSPKAISTRYNLTEMELMSGLVLKNGRRRRIRDGDLKVRALLWWQRQSVSKGNELTYQ